MEYKKKVQYVSNNIYESLFIREEVLLFFFTSSIRIVFTFLYAYHCLHCFFISEYLYLESACFVEKPFACGVCETFISCFIYLFEFVYHLHLFHIQANK